MTLIAKSQVGVERDVLAVGGNGASLQTAIIVYAPGVANPSAPIFNTWIDVQRAINATQGSCELWVDMVGLAPGAFAHVPSDADLDGQGRLTIIGKGPNGEAELVMDDGAQIRNVQGYRTIVFRSRATTRPPIRYNLDGLIVEAFDATFLFDGVFSQPVIEIDVASYMGFFFLGSSELSNSHNPGAAVLNIGGAITLDFAIGELYFPRSFDSTISGPAGSTLQIQKDASVPPQINLPAFHGALTITNIDSALGSLGGTISFFGAPPVAQPVIAGSRGGNVALASLLAALASLGLIVDGSTP